MSYLDTEVVGNLLKDALSDRVDLQAIASTRYGAAEIANMIREILMEQYILKKTAPRKEKIELPYLLSDHDRAAISKQFEGLNVDYGNLYEPHDGLLVGVRSIITRVLLARMHGNSEFPVVVYSDSVEFVEEDGRVILVGAVQTVGAYHRLTISINQHHRLVKGSSERAKNENTFLPRFVTYFDNVEGFVNGSIFDLFAVPTNLSQICYTMFRRGEGTPDDLYVPESMFFLPFCPDVFLAESGFIECIGLRFIKTAKEIRFFSKTDEYCYPKKEYFRLVQTSYYSDPQCPGLQFFIEQGIEHPGIFVGRIRASMSVPSLTLDTYKAVGLTDLQKPDVLVEILVNSDSTMKFETRRVPRDVFDKVYVTAITLSAQNFNLEAVVAKLRLSTELVIIKGKTFKLNEALPIGDLAAIACAIYVHAYVKRFETTQMISNECTRILKEERDKYSGAWYGRRLSRYLLYMLMISTTGGIAFMVTGKVVSETTNGLRKAIKWLSEMHQPGVNELPLIREFSYESLVIKETKPVYFNNNLLGPAYRPKWFSEVYVESHESAELDETINAGDITVDEEPDERVAVIVARGEDMLLVVGDESILGLPCTPSLIGFDISHLPVNDSVGMVYQAFDKPEVHGIVMTNEITKQRVLLVEIELPGEFRREFLPWYGEFAMDRKLSSDAISRLGLATIRQGLYYFNCGCRVVETSVIPLSDICFAVRGPKADGELDYLLNGVPYKFVASKSFGAECYNFYFGTPHGLGISTISERFPAVPGEDLAPGGFYLDRIYSERSNIEIPLWKHYSRSWDHRYAVETYGGVVLPKERLFSETIGSRTAQVVERTHAEDLGVFPINLQGLSINCYWVQKTDLEYQEAFEREVAGFTYVEAPSVIPVFPSDAPMSLQLVAAEVVNRRESNVVHASIGKSVIRSRLWFGKDPPQWFVELRNMAL